MESKYYERESFMDAIFLPIAIFLFTPAFFYIGLYVPAKITIWHVLIGIGILGLICLLLGWLASGSSSGGGLAFIINIFLSAAIFLSGLVFAFLLKGKRRLLCIGIALLSPIAFMSSIRIGSTFSPESLMRENGIIIARALHHYRGDHGMFPSSLEQLVPDYLDDLQQPPTMWGWLYTATADEFTLGYVSYIDRMGYSVDVLPSDSAEWQMLLSSGPFDIPPTPSWNASPHH